jgi:predicted O-methyltransferase YrrM
VSAEQVAQVLAELAEFGVRNDQRAAERGQRMLNITPDTGQFLAILVRAMGAQRILEIGTSNGYSTIWLASTGAHVESIDAAAPKLALASANLVRARVAELVTLHHGLARDVLPTLHGPYDLIFLDADRSSYLAYLEPLLALLRPGGLLVTDNVVSHAHELTEFLRRLKSDPRLQSVTIPVGKGEEVTCKLR